MRGLNCSRASRSTSAAGNGIFGSRDRAPKVTVQARALPQRLKSWNRVAENPRRKRPIWRPAGNARFARAGWWAHQGSNLGPRSDFSLEIKLATDDQKSRPPVE